MSERFKKICLAIGFLAISFLIGFLIYWIFFRKSPSKQSISGPERVTGQLPSSGEAKPFVPSEPQRNKELPIGGEEVGQVTDGEGTTLLPDEKRTRVLNNEVTNAISSSPSGNGVRSYNPVDGKFYRILDDGTRIPLSEQIFSDVQKVTWANTQDKSILTFPDGSKILYDFATGKQTSLPKHWDDFVFSPDDGRIAAKSIGNNESNRFLVVANPDGSDAKAVEEMGNNQDKVHVSWSPNNQVVAYAFTGESIGIDRQAVVLVGQHQENFKNLIVEGLGFEPRWSPSGNVILYSVYSVSSGYRPTIWVSESSPDRMNMNRQNLGLNTWVDKCVWQDDSMLICAVPGSLPEGAGLQPSLFTNVSDFIYRINLKTGQKINLGQPEGSPNVAQLMLTPDRRGVYFTDRKTGKLMRFDF